MFILIIGDTTEHALTNRVFRASALLKIKIAFLQFVFKRDLN